MAKTEKLGIEITNDSETLFEDWRNFINGASPESLANIVDDFAKSIELKVLNNLGVGGELTIPSGVNTYQTSITSLGNNDAIMLYPKTSSDKKNGELANIFVSSLGSVLIFTITNKSMFPITLNYFITKGRGV